MSVAVRPDPNFGGASVADATLAPSAASAVDAWEQEITFISDVASNATVAATSFGSWIVARAAGVPATYHSTFALATKWGSPTLSTPGTPGGNVTYWFDTASNWTDVEQTALASGLALWSAEANITFSLAASAALANFTFIRGTDGSAHQKFPNVEVSVIGSSVEGLPGPGAYISIDTRVPGFGPIGSPSLARGLPYSTLVHEIGHMIGLGHAGPYNNAVTLATQQFSPYDTQLWSIMSYIDPTDPSAKYYGSYPVTGTDWDFYSPTTPMILDILAAQRIYGRPTSGPLVDGNHIFGFNSNLDPSIKDYFDFTVNKNPVVTIWDGGMNNTLDLSGWSTPATIDLTPGAFTSANGQVNNIAIAPDTVIETAKGGDGSDHIYGNSYANFLVGNEGSDWLEGRRANDTDTGGPGSDYFVLASPADLMDIFTDFTRSEGDRIALLRDGFGLNGTGSLDNVGVNLVYGVTTQTTSPTILERLGEVVWFPDGTRDDSTAIPLAHVDGIGEIAPVGNPDTTGSSVVAIGDFNADGITDILWKNDSTGATSEWLMGNGTMASNPATLGAAGWDVIATGDFNGDSTTDIMWKTATGGITSEWLMSPDGGILSNPTSIPATPGWDVIATGDFNGDGIADLMWKTATGGITSEWLMSPDGGILSNPTSIPATPGWDVIATGDFNGDGIADLMWKTATGGITSEWLMSPDGGIGSNPSTPATAGWDVIATGDFNGDGIADLMWKTATGGITSEWLMSPDGGIGSNPSTPATAGWDVIATGDFNGDGTTDIMWKTATGGITSEWLMSPDGGILSNPTSIPATPGWDVSATGDFNGDGNTDLLWRNATTGATTEWIMGDDGVDSLPTTPDAKGLDSVANGDFSGFRGTDLVWTDPTTGATTTWAFTHLLPGDFQIV